jgi:hypothetical protein
MGLGDTLGNRNWSMDIFVLENINALIQKYIECRFNHDYEGMYMALDSLEAITSPKIDNDDVEKNLTVIEDLLNSVYIYSDGKQVGHYPEKIRLLKRLLNNTFKLIIVKMEKKHIWTQEVKDLNSVMGNVDN